MKWERSKKEPHGYAECPGCLSKGIGILARDRQAGAVCPRCRHVLTTYPTGVEQGRAKDRAFVHGTLGHLHDS